MKTSTKHTLSKTIFGSSTSIMPVVLAAGLALLPSTADAVSFRYDAAAANPNPASQGWTANEIALGTDADLDGRIDTNANAGLVLDAGPAWQVNDRFSAANLDAPGYTAALTAAQQDELIASGWEFSARLRAVANNTAGNTAFVGWGLSSAATNSGGANRRCGFIVSIAAGNAFQITDTDGDVVTLAPGSASDYHTLTARGVPGTTRYDWFVDGVFHHTKDLLDTTVAGITPGRVTFHQVSSTQIGAVVNFRNLHLHNQVFRLTRSVIADGGGRAAGGGFVMKGTSAQSVAGRTSTGGGFTFTGGYWAGGIAVVQTDGAPNLRISESAGSTDVQVLWTDPGRLWRLEQSPTLQPGTWTPVAGDPLSPHLVNPPPNAKLFFRLIRR
jgi:hypothetical protein